MSELVSLVVDGRQIEFQDTGSSLLELLREVLGVRAPKDGCSPQGQCGCCTVLVDGQPRVSCVTPARRVAGRTVTTVDGLSEEVREAWGAAFFSTGASQCGFCSPGIVLRLEALGAKSGSRGDAAAAEKALQAHLCRCTGWRTIVEAYLASGKPAQPPDSRDLAAASRRAEIEGGAPQQVRPDIALGSADFADDTAPEDSLVALRSTDGTWVVGESLGEARQLAGKVQGRRTTVEPRPPIELPPGDWDRTLRTSWVEPGYLETDASWCSPGGEPASPLANGGAFGAKVQSPVMDVARRLADEHGRTVRVLLSREDTVRLGPKRPPMAAGIRVDGSGIVRVARADGVASAIAAVAPRLEVIEVDLAGPPVSSAIRAAGWAEALVLLASLTTDSSFDTVVAPNGATASAEITTGKTGGPVVHVKVSCGPLLDEVVLRSYCTGAAHMAMSWVTSESLTVDEDGEVHDLTIRSFDILRAIDTPAIEVELIEEGPEPINGSDAVFAAVAAATWRHQGFPPEWPTRMKLRS